MKTLMSQKIMKVPKKRKSGEVDTTPIVLYEPSDSEGNQVISVVIKKRKMMPSCVSKDSVDVRVPTKMTQHVASTNRVRFIVPTIPSTDREEVDEDVAAGRASSSAGHSSPVTTRAIVVVPTDPTTDNERVDEDVEAPSHSHFRKRSGGRTKMTGLNKSRSKTRRGKQKGVLKRLDTRSSPSGLFNAMKDFSAKQKRDVIDMGFGGILDLGISRIFGELGEFGYWLVDNFDPSCTSLALDGGRKLAIAEEDVVCTLGIPRGRRKIRLNMKGDSFSSLSEWRAQYGRTTGSIHPSKVYKRMKRQKQGGTLFKQNFLVTFSTVMIDFGSSRYVNQSYFEAISNVDRVKEFNWCAPILESLRKNKHHWNAQPNKEKRRYYGPLTFLMLFYLDRLKFEGNLAPLTFPTITRWNDQNIIERVITESEKNAFGKGDVLERVSMQRTVVGGSEDDAEGEGDSLQGNASSHAISTPTIEPETNEGRESTSPGNEVHDPTSLSKEVCDPASPSKEVRDHASPSNKSCEVDTTPVVLHESSDSEDNQVISVVIKKRKIMPCCVSKDIVDVRVPTEMTQQAASASHNTHPKNHASSSAGHSSPVSTRAIVVVPTDPTTDNERVDEDVQAPSPSHFRKGSGGRTKMTGSKKSLTKTRRGKQKAATLCSANEVNPAPVLKRLDTRSSPSGLFNVMKDFSAKQKRDVIDMGFGGILDLGISHVFGEFGYWLVDNFDPSCTALVLDGGRKLAMAEEDVVCTLGIPRGRRKIRLNMKGDASSSLSEWRAQYGTTTGSIHPSKVYKKMKRQKEGGTLFKQNFLVTFSTVMIDFGSSRYVNQSYFEAISNVDRVKEFNWCAPILESLRKNKQNWNAQPNKEKRRYYGPLTFLMLFYLDRLDFEGNLVPRTLPTITRWNDQNIKERVRTEAEKNAFGKGDVLERVSRQQTVGGGSGNDAEGETLIKQIEEVKGNPMNNLAKLKSLMSQVEVAFGGYHRFEERMRAEKEAACVGDGVEDALMAACDAILAGLKKDSQPGCSSGAANHIHKDDAPGFSLGIPEIEENCNADKATHCVLNDIRDRFDMSQETLEEGIIVATEVGDAGGGESPGGCDISEDNAPEVEKDVEVETITLGAADEDPVSDVCEAEKELEVDTIAPTVVASALNDICEAEKDCEGDTIIPSVDASATNEVYKVERDSEADRITTDVVFEAPIRYAPIGDYADDALPRVRAAREGKLSLVKLSRFQNRRTDCDGKLSIHEGDSLQGNASSHVNSTPTIEPETNEARESTSPGNEVHDPASPSKEFHDPASPSKEVHDPASPSDKSVVKPPVNSEQNIHKKQKVTSMEKPNVASGATAPPYKIISRPSYDGFPPREVKPCHGWIDEDEETEFIELTPAPLPERLRRMLDRVNGFGELAKKRSVNRDGM